SIDGLLWVSPPSQNNGSAPTLSNRVLSVKSSPRRRLEEGRLLDPCPSQRLREPRRTPATAAVPESAGRSRATYVGLRSPVSAWPPGTFTCPPQQRASLFGEYALFLEGSENPADLVTALDIPSSIELLENLHFERQGGSQVLSEIDPLRSSFIDATAETDCA